ncbi:MAG: hypothetical protein JNL01_05450 [Bdellovibrionales bacterium]|nr:hypothetical protein [Bdellovibrionales bacterium]
MKKKTKKKVAKKGKRTAGFFTGTIGRIAIAFLMILSPLVILFGVKTWMNATARLPAAQADTARPTIDMPATWRFE